MTLVVKCVCPLVLLCRRKVISSMYAMTSCLQDCLKPKLPENNPHWRLHVLMFPILGPLVLLYFTDILVNNVPFMSIWVHVVEAHDNKIFLLLAFFAIPSIWVFYGCRFSFLVMILESYYFHGSILKLLVFNQEKIEVGTDLSDVEENVLFTNSSISIIELEGGSETSSEREKRKVEKYRRLSRLYHSVNTIHQQNNQIHGDTYFWILLANAIEHPLYILYCLNGINHTKLSFGVAMASNIFIALESLAPVVFTMMIRYKRYLLGVNITGNIYSFADRKVRTVFTTVSTQVHSEYLDSGQIFHEMDSTMLELMSAFNLLLLTTYLVPSK